MAYKKGNMFASLVAQMVKNLPSMQETCVGLGRVEQGLEREWFKEFNSYLEQHLEA